MNTNSKYQFTSNDLSKYSEAAADFQKWLMEHVGKEAATAFQAISLYADGHRIYQDVPESKLTVQDKECIARLKKDLTQAGTWLKDEGPKNHAEIKSVVSLEFVGILQESANDVIQKCLKKLGAPEEVIDLTGHLDSLSYYLENAIDPTIDFGPEGSDIQETIVKTINNLAVLGGTFGNSVSTSIPRKGSFLDGFIETEPAEELTHEKQ